MNGSRAIVFAGGALMLVFVWLGPTPKYKRAWAAGVITLGLSLLADIAPDVAAPATVAVVLALAYHEHGKGNLTFSQLVQGQAAATAPTGTLGPRTNVTPAQRAQASPSTSNPGGPAGTTGPVG